MSYILDALRKSEQERQVAAGHGAGLLYPVSTEAVRSDKLKPLLTIVAVGAVIIAVVAWLWLRSAPPASTPPAPQRPAKSPGTLPADLPAATAVFPTATPARPAAPSTAAARAGADTKPAVSMRPASALPPAAAPAPSLPADPAVKSARVGAPRATPAAPGLAGSAPNAEKPEPTPEQVLAGLPPLVIGGFMRDGQGAALVIINDKLVQEGEEVLPGLRLEKIGDDGAHFNYKGVPFRRR